jgi:hypothetical protein
VVEAAVEAAADGDAMVVEMTVETETVVGVYKINQKVAAAWRQPWQQQCWLH